MATNIGEKKLIVIRETLFDQNGEFCWSNDFEFHLRDIGYGKMYRAMMGAEDCNFMKTSDGATLIVRQTNGYKRIYEIIRDDWEG